MCRTSLSPRVKTRIQVTHLPSVAPQCPVLSWCFWDQWSPYSHWKSHSYARPDPIYWLHYSHLRIPLGNPPHRHRRRPWNIVDLRALRLRHIKIIYYIFYTNWVRVNLIANIWMKWKQINYKFWNYVLKNIISLKMTERILKKIHC